MLCTERLPDPSDESSSFSNEPHPVSVRGLCVAFAIFVLALYLVYGFYLAEPRWDKNFGVADNRHFFGPNTFYLDCALKNGEYPFWNPLAYCGFPFSADGQASACYPFHLLRSILTPGFDPYASAVGMQILMVLHILLSGLGAFCLAQSYGLSVGASTVCGLAFMFSPYSLIYYTDYYVYSLTLSWTPWILWAVRRALHSRRRVQRLQNWVWAVIFFSLSTLGGFPQLSLYIGVMVSLYVALDFILHVTCTFSLAGVFRVFSTAFSRMFFLVALAVCVALASAVLLLPEMQLGYLGARTSLGGLKMPAWPQDLSGFHLLKCLVIYPGNTWGPEGCRALGIGSLLAVTVAFGHSRRRDMLVFLGLYLTMTDCTLGPPYPLGWLLRQLDFMNITASPWRAGDFSILALGMVVAFGIDAAGRMPGKQRMRLLRIAMVLIAGLGMLYIAHHWLTHLPRLLFRPSPMVWLLPALVMGMLCIFSMRNSPRLGRILIAFLIGCEIIAWSAQMLPNTVNRHRIANNPDTVKFGQARTLTRENRRRAHPRPNRQMWVLDHAVNGYNPLYLGSTSQVLCSPADDQGYFRRVHLKYKAVTEDNLRGTLLAKRCFWLTRQWVAGNLPPKNEAFPPATTVYLPDIASGAVLPIPEIKREDVPKAPVSEDSIRKDLANAAELAEMSIKAGDTMRLKFPKIEINFSHAALYVGYTASQKMTVSAACVDDVGVYYALKSTPIENTKEAQRYFAVPLPDCKESTITLSWPAKEGESLQLAESYVLVDAADEDERMVIEERTPNSVSVTLKDLPETRMLVFLDSYYPGWHAWLDGEEVKIHRADDAFKAIFVPAGTHEVYFRFDSKITRIGLRVSLFTFAVLALFLVSLFLWSRLAFRFK